MKTDAKNLILRYGQSVTIKKSSTDTPQSTRAFIQPLRWDGQSPLYGDYEDSNKTEQFLYIGSPNFQPSTYPPTTIITCEGQNYVIVKAESVYLADHVMYKRAVLEKQTT